METVLAKYSASITELKKHPESTLKHAGKNVVAIFKSNKPAAYLVPAEIYENMMERLEDYELGLIIREREHEKPDAVEVNL